MGEYRKPKVSLPICLHDARVERCLLNKDRITFEFDDGFYLVNDGEQDPTGKATVCFSKVDFDYCSVNLLYKKKRKLIDFIEFSKLLQNASFEIIDEVYGYNQTIFFGYLYKKNKFYECIVQIYHFEDVSYFWEENQPSS